MKITFYSNFMNHHQLALCQAMNKLTEGAFTFVATTPISQERLQMGFSEMNDAYSFVLPAYESEENERKAQRLAVESDVVIIGSAPEEYLKLRMKQNKLTFMYSERLYKKGISPVQIPRAFASAWKHHGRFMCKPLYMLCASAYTAADCAVFGTYLGRTYKWGYFPEGKEHDLDRLFQCRRAHRKPSILWAARMIDWKHPETAIQLADRLKQNGYDFDLNMIGNGEMEPQIKTFIREKRLDDCVHMLGAMPPEAVREHMEAADIFLFTSDFNEGWGAVLNESMNSACAVVASHAIGSVPFLLEDGKNGFIYRSGDADGLYERVVKLLDQPELRESMGRNAYRTLAEVWNANVAAQRFIMLAQELLEGKKTNLFEEGPCSRAKILKNGWYR